MVFIPQLLTLANISNASFLYNLAAYNADAMPQLQCVTSDAASILFFGVRNAEGKIDHGVPYSRTLANSHSTPSVQRQGGAKVHYLSSVAYLEAEATQMEQSLWLL